MNTNSLCDINPALVHLCLKCRGIEIPLEKRGTYRHHYACRIVPIGTSYALKQVLTRCSSMALQRRMNSQVVYPIVWQLRLHTAIDQYQARD